MVCEWVGVASVTSVHSWCPYVIHPRCTEVGTARWAPLLVPGRHRSAHGHSRQFEHRRVWYRWYQVHAPVGTGQYDMDGTVNSRWMISAWVPLYIVVHMRNTGWLWVWLKKRCQMPLLLLLLINISNNSTSVVSLVLCCPLSAELTTVIDGNNGHKARRRYYCVKITNESQK